MSAPSHDVEEVDVPQEVRVSLSRAAVQVIADAVGADILHIKGEVVDRRLRPSPTVGSDVDALVRPSHVTRLDRALRAHDWRVYSSFTYGSPFGHAQTYLHSTWGYFDLHRSFPGVGLDPAAAFELMWSECQRVRLPGVDGRVPSVSMQAVLMVLNAARSRQDDPISTWIDGPGLDHDEIAATVDRLQAHVAFAAATGNLDRYRGHREYWLWKAVSQSGTRTAEWWARVRAARTMRESLRILALAPMVNIESLGHRLGRQPTRRDIAAEFIARPVRAILEFTRHRDGSP